MTKIKGLDTLRAFAVFLVIIQHFGVWFDEMTPAGRFVRVVIIPDGGFGVYLFFVLSGFLITTILLNARSSAPDLKRSTAIKTFFIRRALRIFPIYYLFFALLYVFNYPDIRPNLWYGITYTFNVLCYHTNSWNYFSHTWTLDVEEQFYLLWPFLILLIKDKYLKYTFLACILAGVVTTFIATVIQHHMSTLVFHSFDAFGIGGMYAWCRLDQIRLKKFERTIKIITIAAFAAYCYWKIAAFVQTSEIYGLFMLKTVYSILSLWIIMLVIDNKSVWMGRYVLGSRPLNYMGKISYGIYLYHYVYLNGPGGKVNLFLYRITEAYPTLNGIIRDHAVNYWIHVFIIIGIAALSYTLIEKPILSFKDRFSYQRVSK